MHLSLVKEFAKRGKTDKVVDQVLATFDSVGFVIERTRISRGKQNLDLGFISSGSKLFLSTHWHIHHPLNVPSTYPQYKWNPPTQVLIWERRELLFDVKILRKTLNASLERATE